MRKTCRLFLLNSMLSLIVFSCAKVSSQVIESVDTAVGSVGCENFQSKVFDSLYSYLEDQKSMPDEYEFVSGLNFRIDQLAVDQKINDQKAIKQLKDHFKAVYKSLISDVQSQKSVKNSRDHLQALIELEMGDQSSLQNQLMSQKAYNALKDVKVISKNLNINCEQPEPEPVDTPLRATKLNAGMDNVISTAYQSCKVLDLPALNKQTNQVQGITMQPYAHPDGIGAKRYIASISDVQKTHPYIKVASSGTSSCYNVYGNPLIYDYGGEPSVNSSKNSINLFKDAGTGTEVLGIDCSALVSAAIGAAGLKFNANVENKAIFIRQTSSKFINAEASNFTCFKNISVTPTESIKSGDIAAVKGHVVMIDYVGSDPFGLKLITTEQGCLSINSANFNFTVAQSSPSKGGVGINKFAAKDYLNESSKMKTLFINFAQAACHAKFTQQTVKPMNSEWGIIRHKGTVECLAPRIAISGQSCVQSCQR